MRAHQKGFSMIELMIAITLATLTGVVVLQVLSTYQLRRSTTVGRNDAQISAAVGLYGLEREIRMAGAGLMTPAGQLCATGINAYYNGATVSNGAPLVPLRIVDGGGALPDIIQIVRSDSEFGAAPTRLVQAMGATTSQLSVNGNAGLTSGDLVMVGSSDGSKLCTLMQMSADPAANGSGFLLSHASGGANYYNPADPGSAYTNALLYDVRDYVVNMGRYGVRRYGVFCNDGNAPAADNSCDLGWYDALAVPAPTLVNVSSLASQVVDLQAQYGIADAGSQTVNAWVDATGAWAAPSLVNQKRIKAVRISIIARGNRENAAVGPASVVLWQDDPADPGTARKHDFTADEQRFRYQVLTVVVPLVNIIWAGI